MDERKREQGVHIPMITEDAAPFKMPHNGFEGIIRIFQLQMQGEKAIVMLTHGAVPVACDHGLCTSRRDELLEKSHIRLTLEVKNFKHSWGITVDDVGHRRPHVRVLIPSKFLLQVVVALLDKFNIPQNFEFGRHSIPEDLRKDGHGFFKKRGLTSLVRLQVLLNVQSRATFGPGTKPYETMRPMLRVASGKMPMPLSAWAAFPGQVRRVGAVIGSCETSLGHNPWSLILAVVNLTKIR